MGVNMRENTELLNPVLIFPAENPLPENAQEVWIDGSMGKLYGILQLPELAENGKCPMVIFATVSWAIFFIFSGSQSSGI